MIFMKMLLKIDLFFIFSWHGFLHLTVKSFYNAQKKKKIFLLEFKHTYHE